MNALALRQYAALSKRSLVTIARQPTWIIPSVTFPLIFLALTSSAFAASIHLPGFPEVESFLQFAVSTTVIQGALFGSVAVGAALATDIEGGFFERLVASPVARTSLLVGRVAGAATVGFLQGLLIFGLAMIFGLSVDGGFVAILGVSLVGGLVAAGVGSVFMMFALRTGSSEAVQGSFPLLFVFLFLSSAFFPRNLMSGWFKSVATINPLSHMIEGLRHQVIIGLDAGEYVMALFIAVGVFALGVTLASVALRGRLAEGA